MILKLHMRMQTKGIEGLSLTTKRFGDFSCANLLVTWSVAPAVGPEERTSSQSIFFPFSLTAAQKTRLLSGRMRVVCCGELWRAQKSHQHREKLKAAQSPGDLFQPIAAGLAQSSSSALGKRRRMVSPPQHPRAAR